MDGNGRWAVRRGLQRTQGHRHGARRAVQIVDYCRRLGIRYVTLFTFSRELQARTLAALPGCNHKLKKIIEFIDGGG